MRDTRIIMGMPVTIEIVAGNCASVFEQAFEYVHQVDERFSTYKTSSEISAFNRGDISPEQVSADMREVFALAAQTKKDTQGYFNIHRPDGQVDPSGIVKGWAIRNTAKLIAAAGFQNFFVDIGGDIQASGVDENSQPWRVGIRCPFNDQDIIKVVGLQGQGIATSGTYVRGQHIYNPLYPEKTLTDIVSLSVIGPDVLEADRFATAAFAMGEEGIYFIQSLAGFEAYMVNASGIATQTTGFGAYVIS
jgi:FAD:protein FMN transferase